MFGGKFNHESRFFADGYELSGIESVNFSYNNSTSILKPLGTKRGLTTTTGPVNQTMSLTRVLTYQDPILNYTGDNSLSGSIFYEDGYYGFNSGYLTDYSLNCAVGAVPRVTANFQVASELKSGVDSSLPAQSHPTIDIPTQGSISITCDNSTTNRVIGFDYGVKCNRKAYFTIGEKNIKKVELINPIEYNATVQIDVDDAFMQDANAFFDSKEGKNLVLSIGGRSGTNLQTVTIPNASLVGENLAASAEGSLRLTLNYIGHTGTEDVGAFDSSYTYVFNSGGIQLASTPADIPANWMSGSGDVYDLFIGDNVETIGTYAFDGCTNLNTDLFIKSGIDIIDEYAFQDTSGLKSNLIFEKSDTLSIKEGCFERSAIVGDLILPNFVNEVGQFAFKDCSGLNGVLRLPTGIDFINQSVFDGCSNLVGDLTIPDNATGIGYRAFHQCNNLNGNISIGTGVRGIGSQAFYNCHNLIGNLKIPDATKQIINDAFGECRGLNGILTLGTGLYYIAPRVFRNCEQIKGIVAFPTGFDGIGDEAFRYCRNIEGIKFEGNPRYIGGGAFRDCNNLRGDLNLPMKDTVVPSAPKASIYTNAFLNVTSLDGNLTLGETNRIYTSAFEGCTNMVGDLKIPDQCYQIEYQAFRWCRNLGPNLYLPNYLPAYNGGNGLKEIKVRAFQSCNGFTGELHISGCEQLEKIWGGAFNGCKFSNQLVLPENIKELGNSNVFYANNFTGALRIPSGIQYIGTAAFKNCKKISGVYIDSPVSIIPSNSLNQFDAVGTEVGHPYMYITSRYFDDWYDAAFNDGFANDYFRGIRVRKGSYDTIIYDSNYSIIKQTSDTIIPGLDEVEGVWYNGQTTPDVYIDVGNRVTDIKRYSFRNSTNITGDLFIPNSVKDIGNRAFEGCNGFNRTLRFGDSLDGGSSLTGIGSIAFKSCDGFTGDLIIPDSVKYIGNSAFENCHGFNGSLKLSKNPEFDTAIQNYTFLNCSNFTGELVIPDALITVGVGAFTNCSGFNSLKLGANTTNINADAFENCSGLSNILEAKGLVKNIRTKAFKNCSNLAGVNLGGNLRTVDQEAFFGCSNMNGEIYINSNVTSVGQSAFRDCSGINYIKYEAPRSTLGSDALRLQSQTKSSKVLYVSTGEYDNFTGVGFAQAGDPNYYDGNLIRKIRADVNQTEYYDNNYNVIASGVYTTIPEKWMSGSGGYSLEIGNAVNVVDSHAFRDNPNLSGTIVIPGTAKYFSFEVFRNCPNVENYVIGEGVEGFQDRCFQGNPLITEMIFPYSLDYLGQFQFTNCTNLERIVIPDPVTVSWDWQSNSMAEGCDNLRYLSIGQEEWTRKGVIDKFAFTKCGQNVTDGELFVGGSIDSIRQKAFKVKTLEGVVDGYPWIQKADIMAREIYWEAFFGQENLSELVSRDAVKIIRSHAFGECTGLTNVTYNKNEQVFDWAFSGCSNLKNVRFGNNYAETTGPNANWYLEFDSFRYVGQNVPGNGTAWIGRSHDRVKKRAFYGDFPWLKTVSCYAREIQDEAFKNQTNLQTFNTSARVKVIGSGVFEGCTSLKSEVKCGANGLIIGPNAFTGCPLNNVYLLTLSGNVAPDAFSSDMTGAFYIKDAEARGWTTGAGQGPAGKDLYEWENWPTYIPN